MKRCIVSFGKLQKEVQTSVVRKQCRRSDFICMLSADPLVGCVDASDRLLLRMATNVSRLEMMGRKSRSHLYERST